MKNPNGYGSVAKLSGNRRRPYVVRKTVGYNEKGYPVYYTVGYYATRKEGLIALAEFNRNPYSINMANITVEELFKKWVQIKLPKLGASNQNSLKSAFKHLRPIWTMKYREIKSFNMQDIIDNCGKSYSTQGAIKSLFHHLDRFALELDIIDKSYADLTTTEPIPETSRIPFSEAEIHTLWNSLDIPYIDTILILIYSGWRISELLNLKHTDIDIKQQLMKGGTKTTAGKNRIVPIHPLIQPLVLKRYKEENEYLISVNGKQLTLSKYYSFWHNALRILGMKHTPHECRHTFRSRLDSAGANRVCIDILMGHKSLVIGERVYTHKTINELREALGKVTN